MGKKRRTVRQRVNLRRIDLAFFFVFILYFNVRIIVFIFFLPDCEQEHPIFFLFQTPWFRAETCNNLSTTVGMRKKQRVSCKDVGGFGACDQPLQGLCIRPGA